MSSSAAANTKPRPPSTTPSRPQQPPVSNTAAGEYLLERLRILLNRLQAATEILQNWPETQGDSAKVHAETATELIASIRKIVLGLRSVERHVNGTGPSNQDNATTSTSAAATPGGGGGSAATLASISKDALQAFRTSLEEKCPIPLDLLDLLDVGQPFGLNPQCYARGLMKESMRQLAGLERRKRALAMLATSIEKGMVVDSTTGIIKEGEGEGKMEDVKQVHSDHGDGKKQEEGGPSKRKRDDDGEEESAKKMQRTN